MNWYLQKSLEAQWKNASLSNNFIFCRVMSENLDLCNDFLEMLLNIQIERLELSFKRRTVWCLCKRRNGSLLWHRNADHRPQEPFQARTLLSGNTWHLGKCWLTLEAITQHFPSNCRKSLTYGQLVTFKVNTEKSSIGLFSVSLEPEPGLWLRGTSRKLHNLFVPWRRFQERTSDLHVQECLRRRRKDATEWRNDKSLLKRPKIW